MKRLYVILICLSLSSPLMAQDAPGTITAVFFNVRGDLNDRREVTYSGAPINFVAGGAQPSPPGQGNGGLAFDVRGNFYILPQDILSPDGNLKIFLRLASPTRDFGDGFPAASSGFARSAGTDETGLGIPLTSGVVADLKGNIYVAASFDQRVRRVDPDGILRTATGSGEREYPNPNAQDIVRGGFSGDGGPATKAQLNKPGDVALDTQGNLYVADFGNGRIRMVDREGFIHTFAGNGGKPTDPIGDGGSAIVAVLTTPVSVAVDLKGNVYVAELYAHRVRKIAPDDQHTITTFAGTGEKGFSGDGGAATQARLNNPIGLAVDWAGNLYIADRDNHRIRKVDPTGVITTFAGNGRSGGGSLGNGGPAIQAQIEYPRDLAVDAKGYVYISHDVPATGAFTTGRVRKVSPEKPFEIPSIRLSATSVPFEATSLNTAVEQAFIVSNAGQETPLLVELGIEGVAASEFRVSPTNFAVSPRESQTVTVRFTPTSLRSTSARMMVYHSGAEEKPLTVSLNAVPGTTKSADFDGDSKVGFDDFFLFAAAFGGSGTGDSAKFDLDGNGKIDFDDFFLFAGRFGR